MASLATAIFFIVMFVTLAIGVPIGISLAISMFTLIAVNPITTQEFIASYMYTGVASFSLLSLPFFVLAGSIMDVGGLSKKLVNVAKSCIGNVTGGLGAVAILACMFFGAVSGSAPATVAAIGAIMIPQMVRAGYDKYYATGLIAVAGSLGVVVPPSFPLVMYGVTNNVSIAGLFMAGIGPSILIGVLLMLVNYFISKKRGYKGSGREIKLKQILKTMWDAKFALLMPVIILGGIYGGVFTPTEAAVISVVYAIIVATLIYRKTSLKEVFGMYKDNVSFIGGMLFVMAPAAALGSIFAYLGVTKWLTNMFLTYASSKYVAMLLIFIILYIAGMLIQTTPIIVILSPLLVSVAKLYGINLIQFGIVMDIALCIAFISPPVASNLFVASSMTGLRMDKVLIPSLPFFAMLIVAFFAVAFIPDISIGLLKLLGMNY